MKNANGLMLKNVQTTVTTYGDFPISNYERLVQLVSSQFSTAGLVIAYLDYQVLVGKFQSGAFIFYRSEQFEPRFMQRMRVFSETQELFIWRRQDGRYQSRLREDGTGTETLVVDVEQVLWGTDAENLAPGWSLLFEERGTQLVVPLADLKLEKKHRVKIKTRNYIGFNDMCQAGYEDCRFMGLHWGGE